MPKVAIAIETSCRAGGIALGLSGHLTRVIAFDASSRHATQLISRLDEMLRAAELGPGDLDEVYVSVGPGSFTGLRVGVTAARTLAQAIGKLRCAAVPTPAVVAENARDLPWENLAVILDARGNLIHVSLFARRGDRIAPVGRPGVVTKADFLAAAPRPLMLIGEGFTRHDDLVGDGIDSAPAHLHLPTAEGVWKIGSELAAAGQFTEPAALLPVYVRQPQALRTSAGIQGIQGIKTKTETENRGWEKEKTSSIDT